jgi:DNA-binding CsgD family transcriptional regulator/tetratricopeptide (TPR) repeat protein
MVYPVSGLAWPSIDARLEDFPQDLMQYDAIRLFVERARAISPKFELTPENAWPTVEICRRLDGLPLALELASARANVLTVQEISTWLDDRFSLLTSGQRSGLQPRHQTLRAAIDWSYTLLTPEERILLRRLAVFTAGCTLDIAEAVCAGEGIEASGVLDLLSSLVNKSLLLAETTGRAQARYRLLETIREYAFENLDEAGETTRLRGRHLNLFLARVEEAEPKLNDTYQQLWLNWLEGEHDNLRAALAWSLETSQIEAGLRIAIGLTRFWEIRGHVQEGLTWFERLLTRADKGISLDVHVKSLADASFLAMFIGDAPSSMAYGLKAVALAEAAGDEGSGVLIMALAGLASGARVAGDYHTAYNLEERAIQLLRESPDQPFILGMALLSHGSSAIELGDYDTAHASLDESLAIAREAGDAFRIAHSLNVLGDLARCEHKYEAAKFAYENSAVYLREIGAQHDLASILHNLGHTYLHLGDVEHAHALFRESLATHQALQNETGMAECLIGFAAIALLQGLPAVGARLLGASATIGGRRAATASVWQATRMEYEQYLELARKSLSEAEFQVELAKGSAMSLEQAVGYAQNLPLQPEIAPATEEKATGLTRREREVARLIGQGKSNSEIAAELVLSKRTVETHVSHILSKLGLTSRSQAMRWAIDHGVTQTPT